MITAEIIRRVAPRARQDYTDALIHGQETLEQWGFNNPLRLAALLANACAETGGLQIVSENMNYTASRIWAVWPSRPEAVKFAKNPRALANSVYGARMGNDDDGTNDDDGFNYRGRGLGQTTGKYNYREIGKKIGYDLVSNPELLDDANISLKALCAELSQFMEYCDMGERGFKAVCNGLNRGNPTSRLDPIGWADRQLYFKKCCDALGISGKTDDDLLRIGDQGPLVKAFQEQLAALLYPVGKADGIFGSRTRAAVLAFQAENGLMIDGLIGPETRNALNSEGAKPMPLGERAEATKEEIKQESPELKANDAVKTVAKTVGTGTTALVVSDQTGILDWGNTLLQDLNQYKGVVSGLAAVLTWAFAHWYYFVPLLCYLVYRWACTVEGQAVLKYRLGIDLGFAPPEVNT